MSRFDNRGYLVRVIFGCRPQVYEIPGRVIPRIWRFNRGAAIRDPSLTYALELAEEISRKKKEGKDHG
jgi:hypothetical protein